jgi:hypothetical protein
LAAYAISISSVILFEVDPASVAVHEFEGNAPWSVHMDRIARRFEASQGMEIEAGKVHFVRPRDDIQAVKASKDAFIHPGVDPGGSSSFPKIGQSLALKASDHDR